VSNTSQSQNLGTVTKILSGFQSRGAIKNDGNGDHQLLQLRDLNTSKTGLKEDNELTRFSPGNTKTESLGANDIIFLSKGHKPFALHLPEILPNTCLAGYFFIIRPTTETLLPSYLAWFLNQKDSLRHFQRMSVGTLMPVISRSTLESLPISIPSLSTQRAIVEVAALDLRRRELLSELSAKQSLLSTKACLEATQS